MRKFVLNHPIIFSGSLGIEAVPGIPINASAPITASFKAIQDISTTGNPKFNQFKSNNVNVSNNKFVIQLDGDGEVEFVPSGAFDITGSLIVPQNLNVPGDLSVGGILKAKDIQTSLETASTIFPSGSTKFGDDTGDKHPFTGSVSVGNETTMSITIPTVGGSGPTTYNITEFRNIAFPSAPYNQTQPVTEYAGANLVAPFSANQRYIRKIYAKKANVIEKTHVIFNAITASAPRSDDASLFTQLPITTKADFMFFKNGMIMETDALTIQQSSSFFRVNINSAELGYELEPTDEIIAWGKFNS